MSDNASGGETPQTSATAIKDRPCKFCGTPYTSSSLGRHYDQWIKPKNPKAPDGIHDVEEIRKLRGNITRRQPRNSLGRRRTSASINSPIGTPMPANATPDAENASEIATGRTRLPGYDPFQVGWQSTGVMNLPPSNDGDSEPSLNAAHTSQLNQTPSAAPGHGGLGRRNFSKMDAMKVQYDMRQKLKDATDRSRAAELALREILLSLKSARLPIDMGKSPFDFEPLSLDFPALCTHCLDVPPTLFSSNPHPTSTSWSVQPPDQKQFDGLKAYFNEEFRKWKVACQAATAVHSHDLAHHANSMPRAHAQDPKEIAEKGQRAAAELEKKVNEHLYSAWSVWNNLPIQRQAEIWNLEMCRAFGRERQKTEAHKDIDNRLRQELAKKAEEVENLTNLQQPREFKIQSPSSLLLDRNMIANWLDMADQGFKGLGFNMSDRNRDLNTLVQDSINKWAAAIQTRASVQKPLDLQGAAANAARPPQSLSTPASAAPVAPPKSTSASASTSVSAQPSAATNTTAPEPSQQTPVAQQQQQQHQPQSQPQMQRPNVQQTQNSPLRKKPLPPYRRTGTQSNPLAPNNNSANYAPVPAAPQRGKSAVPNAEMDIDHSSDQDADGDEEMDEDSFAAMSTPLVSQQQHSPLDVARARPSQQAVGMQAHQQHQQHQPHPQQQQQQQQQQHHQQAQRLISNDHRGAGVYMPGNSNGSSNQGLTQGMNMSTRQMMAYGSVMGTNHMGMSIGDHEGMHMG
ncbi:hypothetical protein MKZ38_004234 [Zalerion maritima]|uniref:Uncharacterized protein n=1 Tax=Zalerion maritima TaxID=339359 RepID=A0AAD5WRT4_9PEZI|nr:hypothetical protein MKZ38_004234 [Zalerion maritima]